MDEEKSLQPVSRGSISTYEIDFQRARQRFSAAHAEMRAAVDDINATRKRLVEEWFAENYPHLSISVTSKSSQGFDYTMGFALDTPMKLSREEWAMISDELNAYLNNIAGMTPFPETKIDL